MSVRHGSCPQRRARTLPGIRAGAVLLATAVAVGFGSAPAGADSVPSPAGSLSTPSQSATTSTGTTSTGTTSTGAASTRTVSYGGVSVQVPAAWRVVDLDKTPGACVRLDVATIYTGAASEQQNCPAHVVGRADTLWLAPSTITSHAPRTKIGTMAARGVADTTAHQEFAAITGRKVVIQASWGASRTAIDAALSTVSGTSGSVPAAALVAAGRSPVARAAAVVPSAPGASTHATSPAASPAVFTGLGMDTCSAPSTSALNAWKSSPYRAVGIYLGGANRACGDGNLSASWVSSVAASGWGLIPIYVGLQAPCVQQNGTSVMSSSAAASQGSAAATDAIARARTFGIPTGRPIYNDIENYATGNSSCRTTVLNFLSAWSATLHRSGYLSGVYGGPGSVMSDMANAGSGFVVPDHVWFAAWNGRADVRAQSSYPRFPDAKWADHQRLHQFVGNTSETWGGVRIYIDANWVDAKLAGNAVPVSYGTRTAGPVGAGFSWSGPKSSWHPISGQGLRAQAYYTGSSGTATEVNGASWSMYLTPGTYSALANLPSSYSSGKAKYTITGPGVSTGSVVNQAGTKGYRSIGAFTLRSAGTVTVHVGDNGGSPAGTPLAVDALLFQPVTPPKPALPGSASRVFASVQDASSVLQWSQPGSGGAVTSFKVTASPGGQSVTVPRATQQARIGGLTNGTAYRFTVTAINSGGSGPAVPSNVVTPQAPTGFYPVNPVRLVDTRTGTSVNPAHTALAAGASMTFAVGGRAGSPVPSSATAAQLHVTVIASRNGWLTTSAGPVAFGAAQVTSSSRLFPLSRQSVTVVNRSTAAVQLVVDVEAYAHPSGYRLTSTPATRVVDTRAGTAANERRTAIPAGGTVTIRIAGAAGSPAPSTAIGALLNVTAVSAGASGYLVANGNTATSVLTFRAGATIASTTMLRLRAGGAITVTNHSARSLQLLVDVQGFLQAAGDGLTRVPQTRVLSNAAATLTYPSAVRLAARGSVTVRVRNTYGTPLPLGARSAMVSIQADAPVANGYLVSSSGSASLLNFAAGKGGWNSALVQIAGDGTLTFRNGSAGPVSLILDMWAYTAP